MAELACSLEGLPLSKPHLNCFTQGFCNCTPAAETINRYYNVCKELEAIWMQQGDTFNLMSPMTT